MRICRKCSKEVPELYTGICWACYAPDEPPNTEQPVTILRVDRYPDGSRFDIEIDAAPNWWDAKEWANIFVMVAQQITAQHQSERLRDFNAELMARMVRELCRVNPT